MQQTALHRLQTRASLTRATSQRQYGSTRCPPVKSGVEQFRARRRAGLELRGGLSPAPVYCVLGSVCYRCTTSFCVAR